MDIPSNQRRIYCNQLDTSSLTIDFDFFFFFKMKT